MPMNAQTTKQLHTSHMLANYCSKFSQPSFNSTCTVNFQMFRLVFKKAEEPQIQLPASTGSLTKQESSRKTSISALLTLPKPLTVQFSSAAQSCPTLCNPMYRSMAALPVHHQLPEFIQTHGHRVCDAIQPSHPRSSPSMWQMVTIYSLEVLLFLFGTCLLFHVQF